MRTGPKASGWNGSWMDKAERWLIKAAAALAILLIVAQIALHFPFFRHHLTNMDEWEGIPYVSSAGVR
ncbi:hypothetical protein [Cohnella thailandensis]|uniref:Uncharacterized protein n=1 Tax=Cohnella thailandensis TaxID=557557 RepID=A0A841SU09_9BACL|nr:hypothetical protein [Cohnella thailandensis]MBB6635414.1 hypothetical protein [Cohnella thailandensis]MBP1974794.1 hypothetical protein [Cohnella thailandensis]